MFSERLAQVEAEHFESLRAALRGGPRPRRTATHAQRSPARRCRTARHVHCAALHLCRGQATVAAAYKALRRLNAQRSLKDSTRARTALDRLVLRPLLQRRAAREQDLYDDPDIQRLAKRAYQDALLNAVRERFAAVEMLSDAEVWEYYDSHPDMFYHEESVEVEELLASSPAEAQWLSDQLAAGASFADLADRSVRAQAVQSQARFHFHPRDEKLYPRLVPAIYAAEPGQLVGPIRVRDGYSIFRVQGRNPGRVEPYEQVQRRARALLRRERENAAFTSFVQRPAPALSEPSRDRRASTQGRPAGFAGPRHLSDDRAPVADFGRTFSLRRPVADFGAPPEPQPDAARPGPKKPAACSSAARFFCNRTGPPAP